MQDNEDESAQEKLLHMDVQAHEDDCMAAMGYLYEKHPQLRSASMAVSPRVHASLASESIKMLFMFSQLQQLQLRCAGVPRVFLRQPCTLPPHALKQFNKVYMKAPK